MWIELGTSQQHVRQPIDLAPTIPVLHRFEVSHGSRWLSRTTPRPFWTMDLSRFGEIHGAKQLSGAASTTCRAGRRSRRSSARVLVDADLGVDVRRAAGDRVGGARTLAGCPSSEPMSCAGGKSASAGGARPVCPAGARPRRHAPPRMSAAVDCATGSPPHETVHHQSAWTSQPLGPESCAATARGRSPPRP